MGQRPTVAPTTESKDRFGVETNHPAYGVVQLTRRHGGRKVMFGSELRHNEVMHLSVRRAANVRSLSDDRVLGKTMIVDLEFTLSQWAQFVASQGMGEGTACTLEYYQDGVLVEAPDIAEPETLTTKFSKEMHAAVDERLESIKRLLSELDEMVESGVGKKAMREALKEAQRHAHQLPGSVAFIQKQFASSMDEIAEQAKTEVEGFVAGVAMRTGIEALRTAAPSLGSVSSAQLPGPSEAASGSVVEARSNEQGPPRESI